MQRITLPGTDITTTCLGFGCAGLMRLHTEAERQHILETAFEHGIRHFDTARMYGLGKVEGVLGAVMQRRRDQVTITTKFGIPLNAYASRLGNVQSLVRRVIALSPALRQIVRRRSQALYNSHSFSVTECKESLETSLKELQTDYIDLFLLHECTASALGQDDLLGCLEGAMQAGKIRAFGTASTYRATLGIIDRFPEFTKVVQFESDIVNRNIDRLPGMPSRGLITHGIFSKALKSIEKALSQNPHLESIWSKQLDINCINENDLSGLLLKYSHYTNPEGIVIFSSNSEKNILANVNAIVDTKFSLNTVRTFSEQLASALPEVHGSLT